MPRKIMVAGNWKLNKTVDESVALGQEVAAGLAGENVDVLLCPTFPAIYPVAKALAGGPVLIGGQNLYWEESGAYTGEVSGPLLKGAGADYVIIGHSERRQFFGETEASANRRVRAAQAAGLIPILCVGETLDEREGGRTVGVLESQLAGGLAGLADPAPDGLLIAYEPVWAIGTGMTASVEQAAEAHAQIRSWLGRRFNKDVANTTRILYGGSVKPANAAGLLGQEDVDGALVGGAALDAQSFLGIIKAV